MIPVKFIAMFVVGILLSVGGGTLYALFPTIIEGQVKENIQLKEGTETFTNWRDLPIPALMRFYFFNVTNANDVVNLRAKPILQEVGPYIYKEIRKKENITWHDDNTVSYRQRKIYIFDETLSSGSESDKVILPNIPAISAIYIAKIMNMEYVFSTLLSKFKPSLYVEHEVGEFLFKGYYDDLFDAASQYIKDPNANTGGMFGLMYKQNDTDDGEYRVYTGVDDPDKFAQIKTWQNMSITSFWKNETCNKINGTDGTQFPPFVKKGSRFYMLVSDICRSVFLDYEGETEHHEIPNYRFAATPDLFADPALNPDNACFCMTDSCPMTGLIGISPCKFGAPIYVGGANYLMGEPALLDTVEGVNPVPDKHKILLDIEPTTGIVMSAARRVQVSIDIQPSTEKSVYTLFPAPRLMHPLIWQDEGATIDEANADKFKDMLMKPVDIGKGISYGLIALGILLAVVAVVFMVKRYQDKMHVSASTADLVLK